jgi:hypothetical protein
MKRLLLGLALALWALPALAQAPCIGVGGVNTVPQVGLSCQTDFLVPTYAAVSVALTPGAAPTDIACLTGSATRVVRLKQVRVSGTAGTAININTYLIKHIAADTGGTLATGTALPVPYAFDSNFPAATATTQAWTANPTINDANPGEVSAQTVFLPVTSTAGAPGPAIFYWDDGGPAMSPPVLRGIAQQLCINLNGVTAPSTGLMTITFQWTEQTQ